jgi:hypothetical protein
MEKILWQPLGLYQPGYGFEILIDREFAKKSFELKIGLANQNRFNQMVGELITKIRQPHHGSYQFFEDSYLVTQFTVPGNGIWLNAENTFGRNPVELSPGPIRYHSHNVDCSSDACNLMALVDMWTEYFDIFKEEMK